MTTPTPLPLADIPRPLQFGLAVCAFLTVVLEFPLDAVQLGFTRAAALPGHEGELHAGAYLTWSPAAAWFVIDAPDFEHKAPKDLDAESHAAVAAWLVAGEDARAAVVREFCLAPVSTVIQQQLLMYGMTPPTFLTAAAEAGFSVGDA